MKILLVDDSPSVRQSIKNLLSGLTYAQIVGEAETACAAQSLIENLNPEVIILDLVLKEGSGFDVLRKIKNRGNSPLVIMLTNYAAPPFRKKAQQEGADFFFDKSTEFEKMIEVLQENVV
jgi:DNA-binding NarL/FixJ family response regulator